LDQREGDRTARGSRKASTRRSLPRPGAPMIEKPPIDSVLEALGADLPPLPESGYVKMRSFHHSEDNASATVNKEKGTYKCFVCEGLSGDGYAIGMAGTGLDFIGSVKWVEEHGGFEVDRT